MFCGLQVILTRPRKEPALGQGVIIPLSEPLAALQESPSQGGGTEKGLHQANPYSTLEIHAVHFHIGT